MHRVESTSIRSVGYTARSQTLGIRFEDGSLYHYSAVPRKVFDRLLQAPSKGKFVSQNVVDKFKFKEIT
jgi:hypothetical protein